MNNPSSEHKRFVLCMLMAGIFFPACATAPPGIEAPKISIANIAPKDFALFEQRFDVQLRIQNPNEKELGLNGMRFDIDLNEREFANGMTGETVVIPRFGSQVVNVEVITGISSFLRQIQELNKTEDDLPHQRHRLRGKSRHFQIAVR